MSNQNYIIRGGSEGRERLRILARVMRPTTLELFDRAGVRTGMHCLDLGCGGGDVSFELARIVGPTGSVAGFDLDEIKLQIARAEAAGQGLTNIRFEHFNLDEDLLRPEFDCIYARFLLTHLKNPADAVRKMRDGLKPGGLLLVEDIDFAGIFCYPERASFRRAADLYCRAAQSRGGDPFIGPKLPLLLVDAGLNDVKMNVVQPAGFEGEIKQIMPITLENIANAAVAANLATPEELRAIIEDLQVQALDSQCVVSNPRIVQSWGRS